jgi:plastocyanin
MIDDPMMSANDTATAQVSKRVVTMQGTVSSPGAQGGPFQVIDLLPVREDGKVYVGWLTFTATKPIMVAPMQTFEVANETLAPDFGDLLVFPLGPNGSLFAPALMTPEYSEAPESQIPLPEIYTASVPFAGNGLSVGNLNGEHFMVSYTLHAVTYVPEVSNNVESARTNDTEVEGTRVSIVPGSAFLNETAYDPNPVTVGVGENVTWVNDDPDPHTVTSGSFATPEAGQEFDSGYMGPNRSFTHRFDTAGEYEYFCIIHPNMVGTVIVGEE